MKTVPNAGIEEIGLEVRSLNGRDVLFTTDGRLLANQGENGHIYYLNENGRHKTFRASFLIDNAKVTLQGPYEQGQDPIDPNHPRQAGR